MKTKQEWLSEYAKTHQNPINRRIHKVCVPAIMFSLLGLLWPLGVPSMPYLNAATVISALALIFFYRRLGEGPLFVMLIVSGGLCLLVGLLETLDFPQRQVYLIIFALAWVGQFIGHHIEGKKPSFLEDLQFLLVGPLWLFYSRKVQ